MTTHVDIGNTEITVGSYIAYAALWSRSATLKFGRVTALAFRESLWARPEDKTVPTIKCVSVDRQWNDNWQVQSRGKPVTLAFLDRMIVVGPTQVPDAAREILDAAFAGEET